MILPEGKVAVLASIDTILSFDLSASLSADSFSASKVPVKISLWALLICSVVAPSWYKQTSSREKYEYFFKVVTGFFCFIGHIYPCFFGFRGGKGITVCAAMICLLDWRLFILGAILFFAIVFITKYISFSSILFGIVYPVCTFFLFDKEFSIINRYIEPKNSFGEQEMTLRIVATVIAAVFSAIVLYKHRENINRLIKGEENKIGSHKKDK